MRLYYLNGIVDVPYGGLSCDLHGLSGSGCAGAKTTQDDVGEGPVHGNAHDVTQNCSGATDQGTND